MSKSFSLVLFLVGFVLTQAVSYVQIPYLDTAGVVLMVFAALAYVVGLLVSALREKAAPKKPQDQ
jgi:uncharacterized membrane protein YcfT